MLLWLSKTKNQRNTFQIGKTHHRKSLVLPASVSHARVAKQSLSKRFHNWRGWQFYLGSQRKSILRRQPLPPLLVKLQKTVWASERHPFTSKRESCDLTCKMRLICLTLPRDLGKGLGVRFGAGVCLSAAASPAALWFSSGQTLSLWDLGMLFNINSAWAPYKCGIKLSVQITESVLVSFLWDRENTDRKSKEAHKIFHSNLLTACCRAKVHYEQWRLCFSLKGKRQLSFPSL